MDVPKIDVDDEKLSQLLAYMSSGTLQVPRFQRDFVWPLSKTRALLDSIYKEFPIGTIFLWRAPAENAMMFRSLEEMGIPEPSRGRQVSYILDGQQRLSSLFAVIRGVQVDGSDYGRICVDLDAAARFDEATEEGFDEPIFVYRKPDDAQYVAVRDLVGERSLEIYDDLPQEWKPFFHRAKHALETYPFSVVWVQEQSLADAIDIFQRINQGGKRLSRYDLVCANLWTKDFDFRKRVNTLNENLVAEGFGGLHETIYTQSFALILADRCTTAAELSLETEAVLGAWERVIRAIDLAVEFASANFGVKRAEFLPYRGIIPVLAYFFYHAPSTSLPAVQRELLWKWFWRVTLSERYSSTSPSRMAEDAQQLIQIFQGEAVEFDYPSKVSAQSVARVKMTQTSSALRNAVVCMMALKTPMNFKDGSPINLWDPYFSDLKRAERHHVFPVGYLKIHGGSERVHAVPNFCFIPSDLNKEIGSQAPSIYLGKFEKVNPNLDRALESHLLPKGTDSALRTDDFEIYLQTRSQMLADELNKLLGEIPDIPSEPTGVRPTMNLVDVMEVRLRDFIDGRLRATLGDTYWKESIPGDIIASVKDRIDDELRRHPYRTRSEFSDPRRRLDYCDVGDYQKIMATNWELFEPVFRAKSEMQKHIHAYQRLRNSVQHNRPAADIERQEGELAMKWLEQTLDHYDSEALETSDGSLEEVD